MENIPLENVPLSQLFVGTLQRTNDFNALSWLECVDKSTLKRIIEYGEIFFNSDHLENPPFECLDFLTLSFMIGEEELNEDSHNFSIEMKESCIVGLTALASCEKLRRDGFIRFVGDGKITNYNENTTGVELTTMGNAVGSSMKTLFDISEEVDKTN
jgi:hypothetical protein